MIPHRLKIFCQAIMLSISGVAMVALICIPGVHGRDIESFSIQVASYKKEALAQREAARLRSLGLKAFVKKALLKKKGTWYRVYFGSFPDAGTAHEAAKRAVSRGIVSSYFVKKTSPVPLASLRAPKKPPGSMLMAVDIKSPDRVTDRILFKTRGRPASKYNHIKDEDRIDVIFNDTGLQKSISRTVRQASCIKEIKMQYRPGGLAVLLFLKDNGPHWVTADWESTGSFRVLEISSADYPGLEKISGSAVKREE